MCGRDSGAEAVAIREWMQEVVDWICGRLSTRLGSVWGVKCWWNYCVSWRHCRDGLGKSIV